jgi:hypothetical protein
MNKQLGWAMAMFIPALISEQTIVLTHHASYFANLAPIKPFAWIIFFLSNIGIPLYYRVLLRATIRQLFAMTAIGWGFVFVSYVATLEYWQVLHEDSFLVYILKMVAAIYLGGLLTINGVCLAIDLVVTKLFPNLVIAPRSR